MVSPLPSASGADAGDSGVAGDAARAAGVTPHAAPSRTVPGGWPTDA